MVTSLQSAEKVVERLSLLRVKVAIGWHLESRTFKLLLVRLYTLLEVSGFLKNSRSIKH
jgi:hypothetical protein